MARPRIFVSSTYFDLRVVRADLERFLRELGYEPVLFERGHVAYGKEEALEEYCYREITTCDVVVTIIGGKYGTQSRDKQNSITQKELKTALELGKQVYVFVERAVHAESRTFAKNRDVEGFEPVSVDDKRIFNFLEDIYALPGGNPVEAFDTSDEITTYLREQFSGLFQRLLQESARQKEVRIIQNLKETAGTLNQLVTFLTEERSKGDDAIKDILLLSHPAFAALKVAADIPYRVLFQDLSELKALLGARSFTYEDMSTLLYDYHEFENPRAGYSIRVSESIFDENEKLKVIRPEEWDNSAIVKVEIEDDNSEDEAPPF